jgi:putative ABC transport system permease protein
MFRQKFYTSVSIFGISLTIFFVSLGIWMIDMFKGSNPPAVNRNKCLYTDDLTFLGADKEKVELKPSFYFLSEYVKNLPSAERVTIYYQSHLSTIINNEIRSFSLQYTDSDFWEILKFNFIEGRPYTKKEIDNADMVVVITEDVKMNLFGDKKNVSGELIETKGGSFKIVGVVENVPTGMELFFTNMWAPVTAIHNPIERIPVNINDKTLALKNNGFRSIILASSKSDFRTIKNEYRQAIASIEPSSVNKNYKELRSDIYSAKEWLNKEDGSVVSITIIFMVLFMILPIINLMNLNYNQFIERYEEIGVRKSFGATSVSITLQLLIETFFMTLIGGIIGYLLFNLLAENIIDFVNNFRFGTKIPHGQFQANLQIILYTMGVILFFSFCSGFIPAKKLSKLSITETIRGGE